MKPMITMDTLITLETLVPLENIETIEQWGTHATLEIRGNVNTLNTLKTLNPLNTLYTLNHGQHWQHGKHRQHCKHHKHWNIENIFIMKALSWCFFCLVALNYSAEMATNYEGNLGQLLYYYSYYSWDICIIHNNPTCHFAAVASNLFCVICWDSPYELPCEIWSL